MEQLNQLLKNQMTNLVLTGNTCPEHEWKTVKTILVDGEEVCPLCQREAMNEELTASESRKIKQSLALKDYNTLKNKSILTNKELFNATFGTYETKLAEESRNKERAIKVFQKYKNGETFNTWFTGLPGVGKSHLAMSILQNLNEFGSKDKSCLFISFDEMLLRIRNSFDNKESMYTEFYFVDLLSSVDYLVIDDLGAETGRTKTEKKASDFTSRILYAISNARQDKSTIITTNLSKSELADMYDPKLVSRLQGSIALIDFKETSDKRVRQIDI